ncbi:MAG: hypothetical protein AAGD23_08020 [Pseudomonadota bacterium]
MTTVQVSALKIAAVLWVIWGLVHALAGFIVLSGSAAEGVQAIADAVDPALLVGPYPDAAGGILNQHGWNLLWFGIVTGIGGVFIWRANLTAIWVTALIGGLADLGYFLFLDLAGYVNFFPGTVMTLVSSTAIILSGYVWLTHRNAARADA